MLAKKERKSGRNLKNLIKIRCCVIPETDAGASQKHFLPFRVLLNVGIDPNFPQKLSFFLVLYSERNFALRPEKNIFSLATLTQ